MSGKWIEIIWGVSSSWRELQRGVSGSWRELLGKYQGVDENLNWQCKVEEETSMGSIR